MSCFYIILRETQNSNLRLKLFPYVSNDIVLTWLTAELRLECVQNQLMFTCCPRFILSMSDHPNVTQTNTVYQHTHFPCAAAVLTFTLFLYLLNRAHWTTFDFFSTSISGWFRPNSPKIRIYTRPLLRNDSFSQSLIPLEVV